MTRRPSRRFSRRRQRWEAPPPSDSTATGTITTVAGSQTENGTVTILTRGTDQTSEQIQTPSGFTLVYSRGQAAISTRGQTQTRSVNFALTAQSAYFPLPLLVASLNSPDTAYKDIGMETLDGTPEHHVQLWNTFASVPDLQALATTSVRDIWLDPSTGLPKRMAYTRRVGGGAAAGMAVEVSCSDYRSVSGVLYPFSISVSINRTPWATISVQSVTFNNGLTDANFPVQ